MSRPAATANLPAGKVHCLPAPRPCGSMAPRAPRLSATAERYVLKTPDSIMAHKRQTAPKRQWVLLERAGNGAHELHRNEDALFSARRDEENLKLRELFREKKQAPSTPTPPKDSRKTTYPDSTFFPQEPPPLPSLRGATKTRRPSSGPRKTRDQSLHTAGVSLPLADPPSLPYGTPVSTPTPLKGIARIY